MVTACRSDGQPYTSSAVIAGSISPQLIKDAFRMFNKRVDKALKKVEKEGMNQKFQITHNKSTHLCLLSNNHNYKFEYFLQDNGL